MDVSGLADFISQVGFPIFAFCLMVWQGDKQSTRWQTAIDSLTDAINKMLRVIEGVTMNEHQDASR